MVVQVMKFNGQDIQNLRQLVELIEAADSPFFVFELDHDEVVVLDAAEARASTPDILRNHNIPQQCSDDLRQPPPPAVATAEDAAPPAAASGSSATAA